jgi:hypothetical protein
MEMEFRTQARVIAVLTGLAVSASQGFDLPARWNRFLRSPQGTLSFSATDVSFLSADGKHRLSFPLQEVQQLYISAERVAVLTYEDRKLHLGRDRKYEFDRLPPGFAEKVYPLLHPQLGARLVAAIRGPDFPAEYEIPVKLLRSWGGPEGRLAVGGELIAFRSPESEASRFWWIHELDSISRSSPMDLTIMAFERTSFSRLAPREFRFQLKEPLPEERYHRLWRRINRAKGLKIFPQNVKE